MQVLILVATVLSLNGFLSAGDILDVKGGFSHLTGGVPTGWTRNRPIGWDDEATIALNPIDGTEKQALKVTSQNKVAHLYFNKKWLAATGNKCIIKAMVKGKGQGTLGIYTYPGGLWMKTTFQATEEWTECIAEQIIPEQDPEIDEICIVITTGAGASIEFSDARAEIVK